MKPAFSSHVFWKIQKSDAYQQKGTASLFRKAIPTLCSRSIHSLQVTAVPTPEANLFIGHIDAVTVDIQFFP